MTTPTNLCPKHNIPRHQIKRGTWRCRLCHASIQDKYITSPKGRYKASILVARKKGQEFALTFNEYTNLISKTCHYCHSDLSPYGIGLDRLDNSLGYIPSNVVPCCPSCNRIRSDEFTPTEMHQIANLISELKGTR